MNRLDALPERMLLVTQSPAEGARLAGGFVDVVVVSPDQVGQALEASSFPCVGISAVPDRTALVQVVEQVRQHAGEDVLVLLEASERSALPALHEDLTPLAGLALVGVDVVAGLPCLVLRPTAGAAAPDLGVLVRYLAAVSAAREVAQPGAAGDTQQPGSPEGEPRPEAPQPPPPPVARSSTARLRRWALPAGALLLVVVAVQAVVAVTLTKGWTEGLAAVLGTVLLAPVLAGLLYLVRGQRRLARSSGRVARDVKRVSTDRRKAHQELRSALDDQRSRLEVLERKLEVVEVSTVDTSRRFAELLEELAEHRAPSA